MIELHMKSPVNRFLGLCFTNTFHEVKMEVANTKSSIYRYMNDNLLDYIPQ